MEKETKFSYQQPRLTLVALGTRRVLCQSGLEDYQKGNDIDFGDE